MLQMLVQVTAGSSARSYYDEKTLTYKGTRPGSHPYPYAYGFIIGTHSEDGDCVDCYLLTKDPFTPGTIVECEPVGLLEQHEGDEIDHKVLAVLPGHSLEVDDRSLEELQDFIYAIFARFPEMKVRVGPLHARDAALQYLQAHANL